MKVGRIFALCETYHILSYFVHIKHSETLENIFNYKGLCSHNPLKQGNWIGGVSKIVPTEDENNTVPCSS